MALKNWINKKQNNKTTISDYISNCNVYKNERIIVNNFSSLNICRNKFETLISEAILIKRYNQILNKQLT